jgi:hypothetical protein
MNIPILLADQYDNLPKLIGRITGLILIAILIIWVIRKSGKK